ncbi:MAG: hypothetical protein H0U03_13325 [Actinobacteria bacterium]|nr:hypothetical protein [Actinomycetota bacterium]
MSEARDPLELLRLADPVASTDLPDGRSQEARALLREISGAGGNTRRRLALALSLGLAVTAVAGATSFGQTVVRGSIERFGAWVGGDPGSPASPAEQKAFEELNVEAYARFRENTRLRLLMTRTVAGKRFRLLGFRDGSSLCLRLIRADRPGGRSITACVPTRELDAPAVVAASGTLSFGRPEIRVSGVIGFADDEVERVDVVRQRSGKSRAALANNAFLSLRARPAGTVQRHPPPDEVVEIRALSGGVSRWVEFVTAYGIYPRRLRGAPVFVRDFERPKPAALPGPVQSVPATPASVRWIESMEPRGRRLNLERFRYARALQPDPNSSFRVGVVLNGLDRGLPTKEVPLCVTSLEPLTRTRSLGFRCGRAADLFRRHGAFVLTSSGWFSSSGGGLQFERVAGLASDGVASMELYFHEGRRESVPLKDNTFALLVSRADLPAKLVARDRRGHAIKIEVLPGPGRVLRCPERSLAALRAPRRRPGPIGQLDLGRRTLGGHQILGRTLPQIIAVLGRPVAVSAAHNRQYVRYGPPWQRRLSISFRPRRHGRLVAVALSFDDVNLTERRLGLLLRRKPAALQRAIQKIYGKEYELVEPFGSLRYWGGCGATFDAVGTNRSLTFGMYEPRWRPYLSLRRD